MAESAVITLFGSDIIKLNPGFIDAYWDFDEIIGTLYWALPVFHRRLITIRNRLHAMVRRHIDSAWNHFDWDGPDTESE